MFTWGIRGGGQGDFAFDVSGKVEGVFDADVLAVVDTGASRRMRRGEGARWRAERACGEMGPTVGRGVELVAGRIELPDSSRRPNRVGVNHH